MLLDFTFNGGSPKTVFPKFTKAVINNDVAGMKREYKRYFYEKGSKVKKELKSRNELFYNYFLKDL